MILDVMLPGLDGFEVLTQLRRRSDLPVIMLTARRGLRSRLAGLAHGADDYLQKPFSPDELVSVNRISLPFGSFTTRLVSSRLTYTLTPLMFVSGLGQFNSSNNQVSANMRLRWEYRPGSELFIVYNEGRDTRSSGFPASQNRALIVKLNRLFRL